MTPPETATPDILHGFPGTRWTLPSRSLAASKDGSRALKSDFIEIHDLRAWTTLGVHAEERMAPREVILQVVLMTRDRGAATTDDLADAVDYEAVCRRILEHCGSVRPQLLETLAEGITRVVLTEFAVRRIRLTVEKPGALKRARTVSLTIERKGS
jgi:dihydroneopterin aldolase